jgi:hypothetical protein
MALKPKVGSMVVKDGRIWFITHVYERQPSGNWDVDARRDDKNHSDVTYVPKYAKPITMKQILERYLKL